MKDIANRSDEPSRRKFISNAAKTFLGVSMLPALAGRNAGAALGPDLGLGTKTSTAQRVIYLYMSGGMTHMDTFDPKPGHENQGPVEAINTNVDGIQLSEYLPMLSNHADKMAIVRGMNSTAGAHAQGNYMMHTSYEQRATIKHPGIGAWMLKYRGRVNPNLPGSVFIGGASRINGGAGFFESSYEPLAINNPEDGLKNSKARFDKERFDRNLSLAKDLDAGFREQYNLKATQAYTSMYDDAIRIMRSSDLQAFDIDKEPKELREAYGNNPFGQGCLLARRLVQNNVRAVEVSLGGWDTHNNNFISVPNKSAILDQALATLLGDLERRGLLDTTLVVLATEFGRTPRINQNAGRDHYPKAFSTMLAGGGVAGGQVYGKTSEGGEEVIDQIVKIPDFNATIAYALGLPLDQVIYSPSKRPFTVSHKGRPVMDLLA